MSEQPPGAKRIRCAALGLHAQIRAGMRDVLRLAARTRAADGEQLAALYAATQRLAGVLRQHDVEESRILDPFLRQVDAWGMERVHRLEKERCVELQLATSLADDADAQAMIDAARRLIRPLLRLLRKEERESLSPLVLRDDFIAIDQEDG